MPGQGERLRVPSVGSECCESKERQKDKYRIVVMGSAKVGKTAIITQFLYDKYISHYKETVEELYRGEYEIQGMPLTLDILDTSGAFHFPAMRALSISTADAFILVFSIDNLESWEEVKRLRELILETKQPDVPIVVVGNKSDLEEKRLVPKEMTETIVSIDWENGFVSCSAKNNENIVEIFKELLIQAKVKYNLSPAVRRRRQSLPTHSTTSNLSNKHMLKRNSCSVA